MEWGPHSSKGLVNFSPSSHEVLSQSSPAAPPLIKALVPNLLYLFRSWRRVQLQTQHLGPKSWQ